MPATPLVFPNTIRGTTLSPKTMSYLHNCYNLGGILVQRETYRRTDGYNGGGRPSGAGDHVGYGLMVSADGEKIYSVFGSKVYVGDSTTLIDTEVGNIVTTTLSTIGDAPRLVSYAVGFTGIAVTTRNTNYFIDTSADTIAAVTDPDLPVCSDVEYLDGRYVWLANDGSAVYFSAVDDATTIESTSFFDAESRPDKVTAVFAINSDLYVAGDKSIERFRNVGPNDAPFVPVKNSVISVGYIGGLIKLSDRVYFIGRRVGQGLGIFELTGSQINKISNSSVDEYLNSFTPAFLFFDKIKACETQVFNSYGYDVIQFNFNQGTGDTNNLSLYCINVNGNFQWGFLSDNPENGFDSVPANSGYSFYEWGIADINVANELRLFHFQASIYFDGDWYAQRDHSLSDSGIFRLGSNNTGNLTTDQVNTTDEPVTWGFRMGFNSPNGRDISLESVKLIIDKQGSYRTSESGNVTGGDSSDVFNLRLSSTGSNATYSNTWSAEFSRPFGDITDDGLVEFTKTGGLITTNNHISMIVETHSDSNATIIGAFIDD